MVPATKRDEPDSARGERRSRKLSVVGQREETLIRLDQHDLRRVIDRVAWILSRDRDARNSDAALVAKYWQEFHPQLCKEGTLRLADLSKLDNWVTLVRARRTIQNTYHLFAATPEVEAKRLELSERYSEAALDSARHVPHYNIHMDDSGKTAETLVVGSVWILSDDSALFGSVKRLREKHGFKKEFHFATLRRAELPVYIDFVDLFLEKAGPVAFKVITVPSKGIRKTHHMMVDLYYHLLVRGVEHEMRTGRTLLPRGITVWHDAEEAALDRVKSANLEERLKAASKTLFGGMLHVVVQPVDSVGSVVMQMADLVTASVSRVINRQGGRANQKDELADHVLSNTDIGPGLPENDAIGDLGVHIKL